MKKKSPLLYPALALVVCLAGGYATGAGENAAKQLPMWRDWPNWRGPYCNGSAHDCGEELVDDINDARLVWTSEEEMRPSNSGSNGESWGYSDFAIVDGRLYFAYPTGGDVLATNEYLVLRSFWHEEDKRPFEDADRQARICGRVRADDNMMCLDANTGRTLWKTRLKLSGLSHQWLRASGQYTYQSTPCVGEIPDGEGGTRKVVILFGSAQRIFALDALTGEPLWDSLASYNTIKATTQVPEICERGDRLDTKAEGRLGERGAGMANGCPMIADGVVAVGITDSHGSAAGMDLRTGRLLWVEPDSLPPNGGPLRWTDPGSRREYFICHGPGDRERMHEGKDAGGTLKCIEPRTGKVMWVLDRHRMPWGKLQCPAVHENYLVLRGDMDDIKAGGRACCYRITPDGATLVWKADFKSQRYTAPVIHRGRVYVAWHGIFDLVTGQLLEKTGSVGGYGPIADGYLTASSAKYQSIEKGARITTHPEIRYTGNDGEPSVVDGCLYSRGPNRFTCYDLRKRRRPKPAAPVDEIKPGLAGLNARHFTVRRKAIETLKRDQEASVDALVKSIVEGEWPVRKAAAEILQSYGARASAAAPQLAAALPKAIREGSYGQVRLLGTTIKEIDPAAFDPVVEDIAALLAGDDEMVIYRACAALESTGTAGAPAVPQLMALLERGDDRLYVLAARTLKAMGPAAKAAGPALAEVVLENKHGLLVPCALDALRSVGPPPSVMPKLIAITTGTDYDREAYHPPVEGPPDTSNKTYPEFSIPLICWLAGECLKTMGPSVIEPLTDATVKHLKATIANRAGGKIEMIWQPSKPETLIPLSVFGHFGSASSEALAFFESFRFKDVPPFKGKLAFWRWSQMQRMRGEPFEYISVHGRRYGPVAMQVPPDELAATLRGDRTEWWPAAARSLCRRGRDQQIQAVDILCNTIKNRKKRFATEAIVVLGEQAGWCKDAATRSKAIRTLCDVISQFREGPMLPAVEALGCYGKHAGEAVSILESHVAENPKVKRAIDAALFEIRGKAKSMAPDIDIDDDILPGLD